MDLRHPQAVGARQDMSQDCWPAYARCLLRQPLHHAKGLSGRGSPRSAMWANAGAGIFPKCSHSQKSTNTPPFLWRMSECPWWGYMCGWAPPSRHWSRTRPVPAAPAHSCSASCTSCARHQVPWGCTQPISPMHQTPVADKTPSTAGRSLWLQSAGKPKR